MQSPSSEMASPFNGARTRRGDVSKARHSADTFRSRSERGVSEVIIHRNQANYITEAAKLNERSEPISDLSTSLKSYMHALVEVAWKLPI